MAVCECVCVCVLYMRVSERKTKKERRRGSWGEGGCTGLFVYVCAHALVFV